jgi:hypothetical protein
MRSHFLLRRLTELAHPARPTVDVTAVRRRLAEIATLVEAEHAMAEGHPTVDQELLLMASGSVAHLARRHPCLSRQRR